MQKKPLLTVSFQKKRPLPHMKIMNMNLGGRNMMLYYIIVKKPDWRNVTLLLMKLGEEQFPGK